MIFNNYRAMRYVTEISDEAFTPELICEIHRIVTDGTLANPASAGQLQSNPDPSDRVAVYDAQNQILHRPPPVDELPSRLETLCRFANGETDSDRWVPPVVRAIVTHFMVGYDHYFEDGNGRTARALFYWSMLQQGYWLTEYLTISKILKTAPSKYAKSFIYTEQDDGDLTYFLLYQLGVVQRALTELDVYLARKVTELHDTRLLLSAAPGEFNHRQLALLEAAMKDPAIVFTAVTHSQSHNVSVETARQDLVNLDSRGLLDKHRVKRQHLWSPAANLQKVLKGHD
jgi:Fic family protein